MGISQGVRRDGKVGQRNALRRKAAQARQARVLELVVAGWTLAQMAGELGVTASTISRDIDAVLLRRAEESNPALQQARQIYVERVEAMIKAWWPLATGTWTYEDADGREQTPPPDPRAADVLIKLLDRYGGIAGKIESPDKITNNVAVFVGTPDQKEGAVAEIISRLAAVSAKDRVIEGQLSGAGTTLGQQTGDEEDDRPAPPPHEADEVRARIHALTQPDQETE